MALIKCSECGKEISDKASACPNCGCPMEYQTGKQTSANCLDTISWESVYLAIDNDDLMGAAKLIKAITGASIQEARDTAVLIRGNRSSANKSGSANISTQSINRKRENAVRCLKCGKLYYSDMPECPGCGSPNSASTTSSHTDPSKTICTACNAQISKKAETCPICGQPTGIHICPKCGRSNTKPISEVSKAASIALWGPFAANKVLSKFQCKDCGYRF